MLVTESFLDSEEGNGVGRKGVSCATSGVQVLSLNELEY